MAEALQEEGFLQKQLQCAICLNIYDLVERVPMGLYCMHTFCKKCLDTMAEKPPIRCPNCKRPCEVEALRNNFELCDVLEKLCQACSSRDIDAQCDHCNKNLCSSCHEAHMQIFQDDVKKNMDELRQEVGKAAQKTIEEDVFDQERKYADDTMESIKEKIAHYQEEIKKLEDKLKSKVTELRNQSMQEHKIWQNKLAAKVEKCRAFLESPDDSLRSTVGIDNPTQSLAAMNTKALTLLEEIRTMQERKPVPREYKYVGPKPAPDVGEIISPTKTPVDYTYARSIALAGSFGSGPGQFAGDGYVVCTYNRCVVSDTENHRVQVYDNDLKLLLIFGEQGDQRHQFNSPQGLCVSPCGDLYISDSLNHRIKVYDKYYQLVSIFCCKGPGRDEMNKPGGLAFTSTGELLVCDRMNYRVKVLDCDGTYIRSIGSKGAGPGEFVYIPTSVAVTTYGQLLVTERWARKISMFTLSGKFVRYITPMVPNAQYPIKIWAFTVDCTGNLIITGHDNHQLVVLSVEGELNGVIGRKGNRMGEMLLPATVSVYGNKVLVYEFTNKRIQLFEV